MLSTLAQIAGVPIPPLKHVPSPQVGIEDMTSSYDWARTGRFTACGMFLVGPVMHNWFGLLARVYPASMGQAKSTLCKVATDQMVMAPLFNPLFVSALYTMEGRPDQIVPTLRYLLPCLIQRYRPWLAAPSSLYLPLSFPTCRGTTSPLRPAGHAFRQAS